jgi:hypothetical protein
MLKIVINVINLYSVYVFVSFPRSHFVIGPWAVELEYKQIKI